MVILWVCGRKLIEALAECLADDMVSFNAAGLSCGEVLQVGWLLAGTHSRRHMSATLMGDVKVEEWHMPLKEFNSTKRPVQEVST